MLRAEKAGYVADAKLPIFLVDESAARDAGGFEVVPGQRVEGQIIRLTKPRASRCRAS
jgi:hypothetical protein